MRKREYDHDTRINQTATGGFRTPNEKTRNGSVFNEHSKEDSYRFKVTPIQKLHH